MNPRLEKFFKLPLYQRVALIAGLNLALVALLVYLLYLPKQVTYQELKGKREALAAKVQQDQRIADDLPQFQAEYEKMQQQLEQALTELPNDKEIPTLLTNIASLARDHGLEILRFKPIGEKPKGFYAEVPVELKLAGSYHQTAMFFGAIGALPRIVNIHNLNLSTGTTKGSASSHLVIDCLATTFRFLDTPVEEPGKEAPKGSAKGGKK